MKKIVLFLAFIAMAVRLSAQTFSGHTVASEGAWCWFADPRAIHYENEEGSINMSYIGYIDIHGNVKATQYNWLTGEKNDILVRSNFQPDDHNNPTFLVLPDQRVLIIYSRHTDEAAFYYRVSTKPGDITTLGEEKCLKTANNTTYPSPFILSDDPEHWYLCWRGISWHPTIARLTLPDGQGDCHFDWGPYQMVQGPAQRPYAKYYSNGKDKMYVTYTTGHPDNESPNWVYFNVININHGGEPTLEDIKGKKLSTIKDGPFKIAKTDSYKSSYPYTVVDAPGNGIRDWVWQIALDSRDYPKIAMVRISSDKKQHEYYYARWTGSAWSLTDICDGGGKFHLSNTEYCYSGGEALDPQNPNTMYVSRPTDGQYGSVYEIWKYTLNDNGKILDSQPITTNSVKNNVRPYVLPASQGSPMRLVWMNGDYYHWIVSTGHPEGYPTSIACDYDWDAQHTATSSRGWTLSSTITMDAGHYYGELLKAGDISYTLDQQTQRPQISLGGKTYVSQNKLLTSDGWATSCPSNSTDGKNYPSKLASWTLTLTFDADRKQLTVYRNGLIDQRIDLSEELPEPTDATPSCLSQQEVQQYLESQLFQSIKVPAQTCTDIILPARVGGENITWASSNEGVLSADGIYHNPQADTEVKLTASTAHCTQVYSILVKARDITHNLLCSYDFESAQKGIVTDLSGRGNHLQLMGSAKADGRLNLTANTVGGFSTNGYALVPAAVMDSLRSYTVLFEATPSSLSTAPRFYDFGANSGNSIFCRANALSAGIKYAGGTTTLTNSSMALQTGKTYKMAVVYDASDHSTYIYVNGELAASGRENINEPYLISLANKCDRNYIGRTQWWDTSSSKDNADYCGTMDNFQMYNTHLSLREICEIQGLPYESVQGKDTFENGNLEAGYKVMENSGVDSDRAIHVPNGWTLNYSPRDAYDLTALKNGDPYYSNFFATKPQCEAAGNQTLWIRQRWGASILDYSQTVLLPAGEYTLSASVYATTSNNNNKANVYVGNQKKSATNSGTWQTLTINFQTDGSEPVCIGFQADHQSDEFISGFDNFVLQAKEADSMTSPLSPTSHSIIYNLDGKPAAPRQHGIIVQKGKKLLR